MTERLRTLLARRGVRVGLGLGAFVAWVASGIYMVPPTSVAVTRLFGAVQDQAVPPGVHWWWPRPIGCVDRAEVTRTFAMPIGVRPQAKPDATGHDLVDPIESRWVTGDTNIIHLRSKVSWRIADPGAFLLRTQDPERLLRVAVGAAFTAATSGMPVDDILTSGRLLLREQVQRRAQGMLDGWRVGIQVLSVNLDGVDAPAPVVKAFQEVQNARADRERLVSEAEAYANTTVPVARGEAQKTLLEAKGFEDRRLNAARADADRFARLAAEHDRDPALLEKRLYLETAERVMPRVKRYVLEPGGRRSMPIRILE
ncbi:MAG: FtsH protease activity modulator HflK [bacterium]|nr:FtsH protease activity modulator HflK [bacterium]